MATSENTQTLLDSSAAFALIEDIFQKLEISPDDCTTVAETLMEASLSGYDSHGIMRVPMYAADIRRGAIDVGAQLEIVQETPASIHLDAHFALGPIAATEAVRLASTKAEEVGIGCVGLGNSNDIGRLGGYLHRPASAGLIAVMLVNDAGGGPWVAPWGGTQPFLSTNPIAAAIPWRQDLPIVIDISTSIVAGGKLKMLANLDQTPPEDWLVDLKGNPTTDLSSFFTLPRQSSILPLGGLVAGHKGFALSLLVDLLAGALGGSGCSSGEESDLNRNGVFVVAIDPAKFVGRQQFEASVTQFVARLKVTDKAPGTDEILVPGERAHQERQKRRRNGIPVDAPTRAAITALLTEIDLKNTYGL